MVSLCPTVVDHPSVICIECKGDLRNYAGFWIFLVDVHNFSDKCSKCQCRRQEHVEANYYLHYEILNNKNAEFIDEIEKKLDRLREAIVDFGCVFMNSSQLAKPHDSILSFLNRIIDEENKICRKKEEDSPNLVLHKKLRQFKAKYEQRQSAPMSERDSIDLLKI